MEKFARWGAGDAPGSALLDCKETGISEQSYYRWRKEYGALQKGLRCCPSISDDGFNDGSMARAPKPSQENHHVTARQARRIQGGLRERQHPRRVRFLSYTSIHFGVG
jgi:hypothetical protein